MANTFKYTDATGPAFTDGTTTFTATFDLQSLLADRTYTFPDASGTIALTTGSTSIVTVGTITTGTWHGTKIGLAYGGTNADLSATGGASQVLKQSSAGANITVGQLAVADLSDFTANVAADVSVLSVTDGATTTLAQSTVPQANAIIKKSGGGTLATYTLGLEDGLYGGTIYWVLLIDAVTALSWTTTNIDTTEGLSLPASAAAGDKYGFVYDAGGGGGVVGWKRFL